MTRHGLNHFFATLSVRESPWQFVTSAGAELTIGTPLTHIGLNATRGVLWLKEGASGKPVPLNYAGLGTSAGLAMIPFPGNISLSLPQMPSSGTVYTLPFAGATLTLHELRGAFVLVGLAGDFGAGWGQCLMFLGGNSLIASALGAASAGYLQVPALLASSNACVQFGGMSATALPTNVGVSAYVGSVA
jgi:hypothetical protein